jgi:hypothetical protein
MEELEKIMLSFLPMALPVFSICYVYYRERKLTKEIVKSVKSRGEIKINY